MKNKSDADNEKSKLSEYMFDLEKAKGHDARSKIRKKIYGLGHRIAPKLIPYLNSKDDFIRWEVVSFLGEIADPGTLEDLVNFSLNEHEVHARWRSFWAVTRFDKKETIPILIKHLNKRNTDQQWRAALILSMLGIEAAGKVLVKGLKSTQTWIQWEALSAIKSLKYKPAIRGVRAICITSSNSELRREGVLALGAIGTPKAIETLIFCLGDPDPQVRWRACMAFTKNASQKDIPLLKKLLSNEKSDMVIEQLNSDINYLTIKS